MSLSTPRQPPKFVPTLTERVEVVAPHTPNEAAGPEPECDPFPLETPVSAFPSAMVEQRIHAWLDLWLSENAAPLVEQLVDRIADDLRQALLKQVRQDFELSGSDTGLDQP